MSFYKKNLLFVFFLLSLAGLLQAQECTLTGFILEKNTKEPIQQAKICLEGKDSLFTYSDTNGAFYLETLPRRDSVKICITHPKYQDIELSINTTQTKILPLLVLMGDSLETDTVLLKALENASLVYDYKKKKLIFYSDALNLNGHVLVKEFLLSLPVITKVQDDYIFEGEPIVLVLIDGKILFTRNNDLVIKNIPAEFIEKAELYELPSFLKSLTGFEDNGFIKIIDLKPRQDFKNSLFGQSYMGVSNVDRWNTGANFNFMNDKRRFHLFFNTNNINNRLYTPLNLAGVEGRSNLTNFQNRTASDASGRMNNFFNSINDLVVDQNNGINETVLFGASYSNTLKKWSFTGNYFFDKTLNETKASFDRVYFLIDSDSLAYQEKSNAKSTNLTHRFAIAASYKIDSLHTFRMFPSLFIQDVEGQMNIDAQYFINETFPDLTRQKIISKATDSTTLLSKSYLIQYPLFFEKKFLSSKRRTAYFTLSPTYFRETRPGHSLSYFTLLDTVQDDADKKTGFELDKTQENERKSLLSELAYTEGVGKNASLMLLWRMNLQTNEMLIHTKHFDSPTVLINDSTVSIDMKQNHQMHNIGLFYLFEKGTFKITPGLSWQILNYNIDKTFPIKVSTDWSTFHYLLPSFHLIYQANRRNQIKLRYERSVLLPNIEQTKEALSIGNPLNLQRGNMNLLPSTQDFINTTYVLSNKSETKFLQFNFTATFIQNYIGAKINKGVNESGIDLPGPFQGFRITSFENMNNYYQLNTYINYNSQLRFLSSNLNTGFQTTYTHVPSILNDYFYYTKESGNSLILSLKSEVSKRLNFVISSTTSYHHISTTHTSEHPTRYITESLYLSLFAEIIKQVFVSTDIDKQYYYGLSQNNENTQVTLWNAAILYRFLYDKSMELKLQVHDILNQNTNISFSLTDAFVERIQTNNLKRYFMLSLTYNIKAKNLKAGASM